MPVQFGLQIPSFSFHARPDENIYAVTQDIAQLAEAEGLDSVWLMDHLFQIGVVAPETDPILDCWTGLAALAATTSKVKLGTLVSATGFRPPSVLAKMTATIDVISRGRLIVGIGGGWCDWEHKAYGLDFPSTGVRLKKLEETIHVLKAMWTDERATYEGEYFQVRGAVCSPKPIQRPHPPILIGGNGAKVTLRITAQHAQAHNLGGGTPEVCAQVLDTLRGHCERLGTDYDAILKTRLTSIMFAANEDEAEAKVQRLCPPDTTPEHVRNRTLIGTPDQVAAKLKEFVDIGVEYFIVSFWDVSEMEPIRTLAREVMPKLQ